MRLPSNTRWGTGVFLLGMSLFICWLSIWRPLQEAARHAENLSYPLTGMLLGPMGVVFGIATMIFGDTLGMRPGQTITRLGWAVIATGAIFTGAVVWWFQGQLRGFGYRTWF